VPVRVQIRGEQTVPGFLESLQQQATDMMVHEQTGLQRIAKMGPDAQHACNFQTLLVVQPANNDFAADGTLGEWYGRSEVQGFTTYGLMVQCVLAAEGVHITASFDTMVVDQWLVEKILGQFSFVVQQLAAADAETKVIEIDMLTPEDKQQLWEWNEDVPLAVERCVHDLFAEQAAARPDAPAICAWDGELTYGELDELSTRLAGHLARLGVKAESIVPLCFEKSMWTVVAMLAVLKAGGAFLLLDPSLPHERLRLMCSKVSSTLSLASEATAPVVQELVRSVVVVTRELVLQTPQLPSWIATVQPTDTAYVIFTSGSTGEPKGCRIEHRSACSAMLGHGHHVEMCASTRTLQFGSYAFAGSLAEILLTLAHGGCICIPSEEERVTGLASAIARMDVNWTFLTSTVIDLLSPQSVPSLRTLCVGGEPIRASQIAQWEGQVHLRQTYGSSETAGFVSSQRLTSSSTTRDVGKASTGTYWVVDPNDHSKLAPVGAVGEVLIEGPVLGREYIAELDKTVATFIEAPKWRGFFGNTTSQLRLYKTGDLARYKTDGSIELLGRKDNQVKVRGQRVELGEIEHQVLLARAGAKEVAVELFKPQMNGDSLLACFIVINDGDRDDQADKHGRDALSRVHMQDAIRIVRDKLTELLPQYMVPTLFVPMAKLPTTSSRKIDRKRLREIGASFSAQQLAELRTSSQGAKRAPTTEAERTMQQLWARVLNIEADSIGLDDSFFRLGGDSIAAMKLVGEARKQRMQLTAADVFRQPRLAQMGLTRRALYNNTLDPIPPLSLLPPTTKDDILCSNDLSKGAFQPDDVDDILPTTHMQRFYINRGVESPREAFSYIFLDLGPDIDIQLLRDSCQRLLDRFPILRAQFILSQGKLWQIVLHGLRVPFTLFDVNGPLSKESHTICLQDIHKADPLGLPTSFMLVRNTSIGHRLTVRLSHAQYDGVCIPVIFGTLAALYQQHTLLPTPDFSIYLAQARDQRMESARYWRQLLKGSHITNATVHLRPKASEEVAFRNIKVERFICAPRLPKNITMASVLSSAWALVLSSITGEEDVIYGRLVAGRNSDIPGIAEMVGPCLNIVPVRARIQPTRTSVELIRSVHEQYISLGQADSAQLDEIIQDCTDWPAGSAFDSVIQHQNIDEHPKFRFAGDTAKLEWFENPFGVAQQLVFLSHPQADQVKLTVGGNTRIMTVETAHLVLDVLVATIAKLSADMEGSLSNCKFSFPARS
jgi:amino acid adenylation domain-containing protein